MIDFSFNYDVISLLMSNEKEKESHTDTYGHPQIWQTPTYKDTQRHKAVDTRRDMHAGIPIKG